MTVGLFGCSQSVAGELLMSDKDRITSPVVGQFDMTMLVNGDGEFAFDLYQALKEEDGNVFYSPYSISLALAMTYGGARGETANQMADTLHYLLPQSALHPAFNNLGIELGKRGEGAEGKDEQGFRLNIVNAIWGQKDYKFVSDYLDLLAENYGAGLRVLDFISDPNQSREAINQWVSDQTEGRIKDLIPEGSITPLTRLVLTNAIYFNAAWYISPWGQARSTEINASPGDVIRGTMCYTDDIPHKWYVSIINNSTGQSSSVCCPYFGKQTLYVFCTLECYNVNGDEDLPGDTTFDYMSFRYSGNVVDITWVPVYNMPTGVTLLYVQIYSDAKVKLHTAN